MAEAKGVALAEEVMVVGRVAAGTEVAQEVAKAAESAAVMVASTESGEMVGATAAATAATQVAAGGVEEVKAGASEEA